MRLSVYVAVILFGVCCAPNGDDCGEPPETFRLHAWVEADAVITQDDEVAYEGPVSFAAFNGVGKAHSYWGALCEAVTDKLICKYQYTDQTYGPNYTIEVELDGWADESGAEFDVWQRYDGGEITRRYTITHTQLSPF